MTRQKLVILHHCSEQKKCSNLAGAFSSSLLKPRSHSKADQEWRCISIWYHTCSVPVKKEKKKHFLQRLAEM